MSATEEHEIGMSYEVYNLRETISPRAPDENMISVRLMTDKGWAEAQFDKALAIEHAEEMLRLAEAL